MRAELLSRLSPISPQHVPSTEQAITMYETNVGRLTRESSFGEDPLRNDAFLIWIPFMPDLLMAIRRPLKLLSFLL